MKADKEVLKNELSSDEDDDLEDNQKWEQIISDVDKNKDGKVSFQEFENALKEFIHQIYVK